MTKTKSLIKKKTPWYVTGLYFKCQTCGMCCSGPDGGYIWTTKPEIKLIADFLKIPVEQLREKYFKRAGLRTTIIEHPHTKDCIFLQKIDGRKKCIIYPVRPNQCRTWPFWPNNLTNQNAWNKITAKCPGINRDKFYSFEEIKKIKRNKKWWLNTNQTTCS